MIIQTTLNEKFPLTSRQRRVIGTIGISIGLIIFFLAYISLHYKTGLFKLNAPVLDWFVNHRAHTVTSILADITKFADPKLFAVIVAVIAVLWVAIKREFYRPMLLVASVGIAIALATAVKTVTHNVRPPQLDMILPLETGFSFPSMHTIAITVSLLFFGYLIYSRKFNAAFCWIWNILAILLIGVVAISRLYLGYHWLTDVTAAFGLGLAVFGIMVLIDNWCVKHWNLNGSDQLL